MKGQQKLAADFRFPYPAAAVGHPSLAAATGADAATTAALMMHPSLSYPAAAGLQPPSQHELLLQQQLLMQHQTSGLSPSASQAAAVVNAAAMMSLMNGDVITDTQQPQYGVFAAASGGGTLTGGSGAAAAAAFDPMAMNLLMNQYGMGAVASLQQLAGIGGAGGLQNQLLSPSQAQQPSDSQVEGFLERYKDKLQKCSKCKIYFPTREFLQQHQGSHLNDLRISCLHCSEAFDSEATYALHKVSHVPKSVHVCANCHGCFVHRLALKKHMRRCTTRPIKHSNSWRKMMTLAGPSVPSTGESSGVTFTSHSAGAFTLQGPLSSLRAGGSALGGTKSGSRGAATSSLTTANSYQGAANVVVPLNHQTASSASAQQQQQDMMKTLYASFSAAAGGLVGPWFASPAANGNGGSAGSRSASGRAAGSGAAGGRNSTKSHSSGAAGGSPRKASRLAAPTTGAGPMRGGHDTSPSNPSCRKISNSVSGPIPGANLNASLGGGQGAIVTTTAAQLLAPPSISTASMNTLPGIQGKKEAASTPAHQQCTRKTLPGKLISHPKQLVSKAPKLAPVTAHSVKAHKKDLLPPEAGGAAASVQLAATGEKAEYSQCSLNDDVHPSLSNALLSKAAALSSISRSPSESTLGHGLISNTLSNANMAPRAANQSSLASGPAVMSSTGRTNDDAGIDISQLEPSFRPNDLPLASSSNNDSSAFLHNHHVNCTDLSQFREEEQKPAGQVENGRSDDDTKHINCSEGEVLPAPILRAPEEDSPTSLLAPSLYFSSVNKQDTGTGNGGLPNKTAGGGAKRLPSIANSKTTTDAGGSGLGGGSGSVEGGLARAPEGGNRDFSGANHANEHQSPPRNGTQPDAGTGAFGVSTTRVQTKSAGVSAAANVPLLNLGSTCLHHQAASTAAGTSVTSSSGRWPRHQQLPSPVEAQAAHVLPSALGRVGDGQLIFGAVGGSNFPSGVDRSVLSPSPEILGLAYLGGAQQAWSDSQSVIMNSDVLSSGFGSPLGMVTARPRFGGISALPSPAPITQLKPQLTNRRGATNRPPTPVGSVAATAFTLASGTTTHAAATKSILVPILTTLGSSAVSVGGHKYYGQRQQTDLALVSPDIPGCDVVPKTTVSSAMYPAKTLQLVPAIGPASRPGSATPMYSPGAANTILSTVAIAASTCAENQSAVVASNIAISGVSGHATPAVPMQHTQPTVTTGPHLASPVLTSRTSKSCQNNVPISCLLERSGYERAVESKMVSNSSGVSKVRSGSKTSRMAAAEAGCKRGSVYTDDTQSVSAPPARKKGKERAYKRAEEFCCSQCNSTFSTTSSLKAHFRTHISSIAAVTARNGQTQQRKDTKITPVVTTRSQRQQQNNLQSHQKEAKPVPVIDIHDDTPSFNVPSFTAAAAATQGGRCNVMIQPTVKKKDAAACDVKNFAGSGFYPSVLGESVTLVPAAAATRPNTRQSESVGGSRLTPLPRPSVCLSDEFHALKLQQRMQPAPNLIVPSTNNIIAPPRDNAAHVASDTIGCISEGMDMSGGPGGIIPTPSNRGTPPLDEFEFLSPELGYPSFPSDEIFRPGSRGGLTPAALFQQPLGADPPPSNGSGSQQIGLLSASGDAACARGGFGVNSQSWQSDPRGEPKLTSSSGEFELQPLNMIDPGSSRMFNLHAGSSAFGENVRADNFSSSIIMPPMQTLTTTSQVPEQMCCPYCDRSFQKERQFNAHIATHTKSMV